MNMNISKTAHTANLPQLIQNCSGIVSIRMEDGGYYPLNTSSGALGIFTKLWKCEDVGSVDLNFENNEDAKILLDFVFR